MIVEIKSLSESERDNNDFRIALLDAVKAARVRVRETGSEDKTHRITLRYDILQGNLDVIFNKGQLVVPSSLFNLDKLENDVVWAMKRIERKVNYEFERS